MKWLAWTSVAIAVGFVIGCGGAGDAPGTYSESVANMKKLSAGIQLYANDYDDVFPGADWMTATTPYVNQASAYVSPRYLAIGGLYGYAMNVNAVSQPKSALAGETPLLFDSTNLAFNAVDTVDSMPDPGRYDGKNAVALVDGTVPDSGDQLSDFDESKKRLRSLGVGMALYASDNDDHFPIAESWMDGLLTYTKTEVDFKTPIYDGSIDYGYAMDSALSSVSLTSLANPASTIVFFDSVLLVRNSNGSLDTRPVPGRYDGRNTWVYADGTVGSD